MNINLDFRGAYRKLLGGKMKQRSQLGLVGTEDGRLVGVEYDVLRACAVDEKTESAYLLDATNQVKSRRDGKWYQFLGERSTAPICLFNVPNEGDLKELIKGIYLESKDAMKDKKYREAKENQLWSRLVWLCSMIVVTAMVLAFVRGGF